MKIYTAYALHVVHAHVQGTESHMPLIYYILGCYSHDLKVPYCLVENIEKFSPMLHMIWEEISFYLPCLPKPFVGTNCNKQAFHLETHVGFKCWRVLSYLCKLKLCVYIRVPCFPTDCYLVK